jgi:hypothetical protein
MDFVSCTAQATTAAVNLNGSDKLRALEKAKEILDGVEHVHYHLLYMGKLAYPASGDELAYISARDVLRDAIKTAENTPPPPAPPPAVPDTILIPLPPWPPLPP